MRAIFVDCTPELSCVIDRGGLPVPSTIEINEGSPTEDELITLCKAAEVIVVEHTVVPPAVLDACPTVRAIIFMGTGAGTYINLDDAARRGVEVYTTPGYGDRSVAEHAFALMLSAARGIVAMDRGIRGGVWAPAGGRQLKGGEDRGPRPRRYRSLHGGSRARNRHGGCGLESDAARSPGLRLGARRGVDGRQRRFAAPLAQR